MNNIYFDFYIEHEAAKIFGAISEPTHLEKWWPLRCSGQPDIGSIYNLNFTDTYNWFGVVEEIELNRKFYINMIDSDKDWNGTTFGFDLAESEGRTLVQFTHLGWQENNHHFRFSAFCWAKLLDGLKMYVETGVVIPFEDRS